jgi:hypothetical protein
MVILYMLEVYVNLYLWMRAADAFFAKEDILHVLQIS